MPQLILEHSSNLELQRCVPLDLLLARLSQALVETAAVELSNCKARAVSRDCFVVGDGLTGNGAFVHLQARLLEGRGEPQLARIGEKLLDVLCEAVEPFAGGFELQITVELAQMPRATYFKATI